MYIDRRALEERPASHVRLHHCSLVVISVVSTDGIEIVVIVRISVSGNRMVNTIGKAAISTAGPEKFPLVLRVCFSLFFLLATAGGLMSSPPSSPCP